MSRYGDLLALTILHLIPLVFLAATGKANGSESIRSVHEYYVSTDEKHKNSIPAVYQAVPFEFIYPDSNFSEKNPVKTLSIRLARNESGPLTIAVLAGNENILDLTLRIDDLVGPRKSIIRGGALDARVVKVWKQDALHWEVTSKDDAILVPEVLMKDDRIATNEKRLGTGLYSPPNILNVDFGTNISSHKIKQIWINVDIPAGTISGDYRGYLHLSAASGMKPIVLPLIIEVLPIDLPAPQHTYGLYYRFHLSHSRPAMQRSRELILADLRELKKAGIEAITIYDQHGTKEIMEIVKESGMKGPLVVMGVRTNEEVKRLAMISRSLGLDVFFYGRDEPNSKLEKKKHKKLSKALHDVNAKVMTAIKAQTAFSLLKQGEGLDWANLPQSLRSTHLYMDKLRIGREKRLADLVTYYWQVYEENPTRNRFLSGFYLWRSGADGVFPYEYQGFPSGMPWSEDTRFSRKNTKNNGKLREFRMWCLTYPSQEGPVSTLQWEGLRAGIADVQYLTLLEQWIGRLKESGQNERAKGLRAKMNSVVKKIAQLPADISVHTNPYKDPVALELAREQIQKLILSAMSH